MRGHGSNGEFIRGCGDGNSGRGLLGSAIRGAGGVCCGPISGRTTGGDANRGEESPGTIRGRGGTGDISGCGNSGFLSAVKEGL